MANLGENGELDCSATESLMPLGTHSQVSEVTAFSGMSFNSLLSHLSDKFQNIQPLEGSVALYP